MSRLSKRVEELESLSVRVTENMLALDVAKRRLDRLEHAVFPATGGAPRQRFCENLNVWHGLTDEHKADAAEYRHSGPQSDKMSGRVVCDATMDSADPRCDVSAWCRLADPDGKWLHYSVKYPGPVADFASLFAEYQRNQFADVMENLAGCPTEVGCGKPVARDRNGTELRVGDEMRNGINATDYEILNLVPPMLKRSDGNVVAIDLSQMILWRRGGK